MRDNEILRWNYFNLNKMTKDKVFTDIQNVVSNNPVIVIGSGASVSYGIPGMGTLAGELNSFFSSKTYPNVDSQRSVQDFLENLKKGLGLEEALLKTKATHEVEKDIVSIVWQLVSNADKQVFERFVGGEIMSLTSLLDFLIYNDPNKICNIVTTNYDRIVEYASCQTNAFVNTGFTPHMMGRPYSRIDFLPKKIESEFTGCLNIWKVHGSLDWFKKDDEVISLHNVNAVPADYEPCIITPGTNKYEKTQQEPYREIFSHVDTVFNKATGFLCIGYGFNDAHVHPVILRIAKRVGIRILIVTKDITVPIRENVMDAGHDYIAVFSDGSNGTVFQTPAATMTISDEIYWNVEGFSKIYK